MPFVHLHGHSMFSNIVQPDALSTPNELAIRAKVAGLKHLCLTDHGSVSGIPDLIKACKEHDLKPIIGSELYVCDDPAWRPTSKEDGRRDYVHVVALAMDWEGWLELLSLLSKANSAEQFYYRPRSTFDQLLDTKKLIFLTACGGGVLSRDDNLCILEKMRDRLGIDRIYVEIQPHRDERQVMINKRAVIAAKTLGLKLVATQDFHYAEPGDNLNHEVMLAIGSKDIWSNPNRWKYPVDDLYLKSPLEMTTAFMPWLENGFLGEEEPILTLDELAEALDTTEKIAARCNVEWHTLQISLPHMADDPTAEVTKFCIEGLERIGKSSDPDYLNRVIYEVETLKSSGFISYFLVLREIIHWARNEGIMVGPGRGSAGGSLVCYLLGITQIDPLVHGLIFERFYKPGRIDLPDIDSDFEDERRPDVLEFIRNRWGRENVANVCTYNTLGAKSAIKDVARVFEIDHYEVNAATSPLDSGTASKMSPDDIFAYETIAPFLAKYPHVAQFARRLTGVIRGTGQHAAGIVIAGEPITTRAVVSRRDDRDVVNWDLHVIEKMGLMKLDVLGLRTLSILRVAKELIFKNYGKKIEYTEIPLDDPATLAIFQAGKTVGVFQFESHGMRGLLKELRVDNFSVLSDATSLYRPGPMALLPLYTSAQTGRRAPVYDHPLLEPILKSTFGIVVYQEQMMEIFRQVGGFTYAESDNMRKIVGKKLGPDEFRKHAGAFSAGAVAKGVPAELADQIFNKMVEFAGYAFNKAHAAEYSMISFWCAWVKAHYPAVFYAAHLSNSDDDQMVMAVNEANTSGIKIEMPDINKSNATRFEPLNDAIILAPLSSIKGIGEKAASLIVGARDGLVDNNGLTMYETRTEGKDKKKTVVFNPASIKTGPFADQADFMARVYKRQVNIKVQGLLSKVGAAPWDVPEGNDLVLARKEFVGSIYRGTMTVDHAKMMVFDGFVQTKLGEVYGSMMLLAKNAKMTCCLPISGSKPSIMMVFDKPGWKDEKHGTLGYDDGYLFAKGVIDRELKINKAAYYITSLQRFRAPPLGYEPYTEAVAALLREEIKLLKPPAVIAFGKGPIEFFAGKGSKVPEFNGKTVFWEGVPVVCAMSPAAVTYGGVVDETKFAAFMQAVDALRAFYS